MEATEENKRALAKKYNRTNQIISVVETILFFTILLVLLLTGLSKDIEILSFKIISNNYLALLIFLGIIGFAESIINFPLDFYSGYILEHKYSLSNQTILKYFAEKIKSFAVGLVIGIPVILILYYILHNYDNYWWLILGIFMFFFSVIIGRIAPIIIFPLFYKFKPIENESIKNRILNLCKKAGVEIKGIFVFDMSKNTKKANAAFTGLGKSKRIILGDTLMEKFNEEEIESVFAHEVGHYKRKHIFKLMFLSTILTFAGLYITSVLYKQSLSIFGFNNIYEISALPLMALFLSIYGLITTPISNIFSRKYEWEADRFALDSTGNNDAFISAMEKLAEQNLADKEPNKIIEFLFHSHPSLQKRIEFARNYKR
ncbi:MAG: M48 family metallopeptidase [Ignavibacteriae bacterium]|nr:M48 family metallopeptidase [Ignavibacteriota bacterium]